MASEAETAPEVVAVALRDAAARAGLAPDQVGLIRMYLDEDPDTWASCCGSACDPCVLTIACAVRDARRRLGW